MPKEASGGRENNGRAVFLSLKAEISKLLDDGVSQRAIYKKLSPRLNISKSQFNRYVIHYFNLNKDVTKPNNVCQRTGDEISVKHLKKPKSFEFDPEKIDIDQLVKKREK